VHPPVVLGGSQKLPHPERNPASISVAANETAVRFLKCITAPLTISAQAKFDPWMTVHEPILSSQLI
jgi:hypothetical protein